MLKCVTSPLRWSLYEANTHNVSPGANVSEMRIFVHGLAVLEAAIDEFGSAECVLSVSMRGAS